MKFQFLPENFSRSENAPPFETRKIRQFEVERIFLKNKKMVHHPSLDEVELRMASPPFCERKRVKRMSADRSTRRGRMSSIARSASEDRQALLFVSESEKKDERRQEYPQGKDVLHSA